MNICLGEGARTSSGGVGEECEPVGSARGPGQDSSGLRGEVLPQLLEQVRAGTAFSLADWALDACEALLDDDRPFF